MISSPADHLFVRKFVEQWGWLGLLGAATGERFEEVVGRSELETLIGQIMDDLVERSDVDERRIAILAYQVETEEV